MTVNYKVGRIWKTAIAVHFKYFPNIFLEQLQETIKNLMSDKYAPRQEMNVEPIKYKAHHKSMMFGHAEVNL
jgi:hypothetical protein